MVKKHEQAFELFKESNGSATNADIAIAVGASEATVRKWKSRYEWNDKLEQEICHSAVTKSNVTKKEPNAREQQRKKVIDSLIEAGSYSPALDLLIEIYLDAYMEYVELRENGEVEEKNRRELARLIGQLGLDGKNKDLIKKSGTLLARGDEENKKAETDKSTNVSKLDEFRNRRKRG